MAQETELERHAASIWVVQRAIFNIPDQMFFT